MNTEKVVEMIACKCFFCLEEKPHPDRHQSFNENSSLLLKAESLNPEDRVRVESCNTCGHTRIKES